jgi:single-strand DNA-binding protein
MAAQNLNHVVITGNLTSDPELRSLPSGSSVCRLRVAVNTRRKNGTSGEWEDKPNFFDVTVWGAQGENAARYLEKGRPVGVQGRLEWREWETAEGARRQSVEIIAENVQFLGSAPSNGEHHDTDPAADQAAVAAPGNGGAGEPAAVGAALSDDDKAIAF